jgi:hypothetical protein
MKKLIEALCLTFVLCLSALAQNAPTEDEYKKNEFYVGYSNQQSDGFRGQTSHGVQGSYVRNVSRYLGIKGDFSAAFQNNTFRRTTIDLNGNQQSFSFEDKNSRYTFLGGVQIKDNASQARFKPFVHALAGVAVSRSKFQLPTFVCSSNNCSPTEITTVTFNRTNFSAALGGGLDIKINKRLDFRAFQVDYNPIFGSGTRQNNVRLGIGFVFK